MARMVSTSSSMLPPGGAPPSSLSDLLQQSRKLTNHLSRSDLPTIQLGLDQIENQSRKLVGRSATSAGGLGQGGYGGAGSGYGAFVPDDPKAHYFLASAGVDASHLAENVQQTNVASAFEPLRPIYDTDVESFLKHEHEQVILAAIEEGRRETLRDFNKNLERTMHRNWEKQKQKIMDEFGSFSGSAGGRADAGLRGSRRSLGGQTAGGADTSAFGATGSGGAGGYRILQMHSKMMRYDLIVQKLNEARLNSQPFPLAHAYLEAVQSMSQQASGGASGPSSSSGEPSQAAKSAALEQCWRTLCHLVGERDVFGGEFSRASVQERAYAAAYLSVPTYANGGDGVALRKALVQGSKAYLEEQFNAHMDETIARNPAKAQLGGVPSVQSRVAAYCRVHLQSKEGQWQPELETVVTSKGKVPIWAHLYFLLRIGQEEEALQAAAQHEPMLRKLDHAFLGNLKMWMESEDHVLPKQMRDRFFAEYTSRFRNVSPDAVDPYKLALYKLIGRIDVRKRFPASLVRNSENWLWLQLSLVREHAANAGSDALADDNGIFGRDSYTLQDVANTVLSFGEAHFDPKGHRPYHYCQILLLVGQFERAVAFLYSRPACQTDAVQIAITLTYYGLLRVPELAKASHIDYLTTQETPEFGAVNYLDFAKLIQRYVRPFVEADAREALQHIYLVCLNGDAPSPVGQEQVARCHDLIRSLVLESRQYFELLGDVRTDGSKTPGLIEKYAALINLPDQQSYLNSIVRAAASTSQAAHRTKDAILLYNLAEEYDTVIGMLNKELGATLMDPASAGRPDAYLGASGAQAGATSHLQPGASFAAAEDLSSLAYEILASYEKQNHIVRRISVRNKETCKTLLELKKCVGAFASGDLEQALHAIESLDLIPLKGEIMFITRKAEEFKDVDPSIASNLSDILLMTMRIISKMHANLRSSLFGDSSRQKTMADLRNKARALLTYAGQLRFRMSNETYSQLLNLAPQ